MKELSIYTEHNQRIDIIEKDDVRYVPIRPLCQLMEIKYNNQYEKLKNSYLYKEQLVPLRGTSSKDGKNREMLCLPFIFAVGWIMSINAEATNNPDKVAQIQAMVIAAMYNEMELPRKVHQEKIKHYERLDLLIKEQKRNFKDAKAEIQELEKEKDKMRAMSMQEYQQYSAQLKLEFSED